MPWEWDKGKLVFRAPTDEEVRANLVAANERYQDQIERARTALEETIAERDRLAAENAELRAGQQTAYENLVKVAKRAKASAARVRELEAANAQLRGAGEAVLEADARMGAFPPTDAFWERYNVALETLRATLGGQEDNDGG